MDEVFRLADRITVLRDGRHVRTVDREATTPQEVTSWMVGREIAGHLFHELRPRGDTLLEIRGLTLPWPEHPRGYRLADVSLDHADADRPDGAHLDATPSDTAPSDAAPADAADEDDDETTAAGAAEANARAVTIPGMFMTRIRQAHCRRCR
jgi:hypothetical protein